MKSISLTKSRTGQPRMLFSRPLMMLTACFLLSTAALFAQTGGSVQPGANDPIASPNRRTQFPDQSILAFTPGGPNAGMLDMRLFKTDGNTQLSLGNATLLPSHPWKPAPIVAAAGRILTQDHEDVAFARRNGSSVEVGFVSQSPSTTTLLPGLADRLQQSTDFIATAVGDLDKAADAQNQYHDEVVVAYALPVTAANYHRYQLAVLNYTNGNTPAITEVISPGSALVLSLLPFDNILGVAVGDFDNDGNNEIAVAYDGYSVPNRAYGLIIDTYRYATNRNGDRTLQFVAEAASNKNNLLGTISVQAGDFNGDGADELAVGYEYSPGIQTSTPALAVFQFDSKLIASQRGSVSLPSITAPQTPRVEVASGQFLFQPPAIQFGRRQIALAWNNVNTQGIDVQAYSVSNDLNTLTPIGGRLSVTTNGTDLPGPPLQQFSLVAGGFMGAANAKPTSSLALSFWTGNPGVYWVHTIAVNSGGLSVADRRTYATSGIDYTSRVPLVPVDWDGKSVYLGAPAHIAIEGAVNTDFILEEPPKHAYFDERTKQVVTVTRYDSNNVHLSNQNTGSFSSNSTDHSNWSIGGSLAISAGGTVGYGVDVGILKAGAEASLDVTAKGSYDYDQKKSNYNAGYASRGVDTTGQTDHDDYLVGRTQTFDVWRYRIYGVHQDSPQTNNFYEVVLPGPWVPFRQGGLNFSWYQPIHENGNILSYPEALGKTPGNPWLPSDIGTFTLPNGSKGTGPQVPAELSYFDGTSGSTTLHYSTEVSNGGSFDYSKTLAESLDIKASAKASIETEGEKGEVRASADAEFHNNNSWGNTTTNDYKTTNLTEITLNKSSGDPNVTYPFFPVVYSSTDGTVKMTFGVPNPSGESLNNNGYQFWAGLYGGKPDPALNLVRRFQPTYSLQTNLQNGWEPNPQTNRKYMRGLFYRKSTLNSVSHDYDFLADNPTDGDTVRIEARIYNYSTAQTASNIPVVFQAIPYDSGTNSEICKTPINSAADVTTNLVCPASARATIGQTTVALLTPLQFTCLSGTDDPQVTNCAPSAFINWNTKGFGPSSIGATQYRIYVVLDPNNTINQLYGGEGPPVSITNVTNTSPMVVTTATPHGFSTGDTVVIGNVQGLDEANAFHQITYISPTSFSLNTSTPGKKPYTSNGTATLFDPGQNNEGFGALLSIAHNSGVSPVTEPPPPPADNYLAEDSIQAIDYRTARISGTGVTAYQNRPLQIRITAFSSDTHSYGSRVLLFDGDPAQGAAAIVDQSITPGSNGTDGTSIWIDWTPEAIGVHHLYAQLQESPGDPQPGNNVATLDVNVLRQGDINGDGQVNRVDLDLLLSNLGKRTEASSCGLLCDIDGDGRISVLDARKLVLMYQ